MHVSTAIMEETFCTRSMPRCYSQDQLAVAVNSQQFDHIWADCEQPPRCVWCGGCHLHKECPEKDNTASIPTCCNCKLVDGEEPHPSNCRVCNRYAKEETRRRKSQRAPKTTTGMAFSSSHTTPGLSFAAALRSNTQQQQPQLLSVAQACSKSVEAQPTTSTKSVSSGS
jgi:hypothetical protein